MSLRLTVWRHEEGKQSETNQGGAGSYQIQQLYVLLSETRKRNKRTIATGKETHAARIQRSSTKKGSKQNIGVWNLA